MTRGTEVRTRSIALAALLIWSLAMVWIAINGGVQHDYYSYLNQWGMVLDGEDSTLAGNTYGPLHSLLAYLLPLGDLAPKLVMVGALLLANTLLVRELLAKAGVAALGVYVLCVPTNLVVVAMAVDYGLNDALAAALVVAAIVVRHRDRLVLAGVLLALAALLKYYPLLLVPLFALDRGRIRWPLIGSAVATLIVGFAAAYAVWGSAIFDAITTGAVRDPKLLSILASFAVHANVLPADLLDFLIDSNKWFVIAVAALAVLIAWRLRLHWLEASVVGLLAFLTAYKVGHQQFLIPWLFLVGALPLAGTASARLLAWLCIPFALLISLFQWGYSYGTDDYYFNTATWVRDDIGFVAFPLAVATIAAYFVLRRRTPRPADDAAGPSPRHPEPLPQ